MCDITSTNRLNVCAISVCRIWHDSIVWPRTIQLTYSWKPKELFDSEDFNLGILHINVYMVSLTASYQIVIVFQYSLPMGSVIVVGCSSQYRRSRTNFKSRHGAIVGRRGVRITIRGRLGRCGFGGPYVPSSEP